MKRGSSITSRIGKRPIPLLPGVTAEISGTTLTTLCGERRLTLELPTDFTLAVTGEQITIAPIGMLPSNNRRIGLYRALIANMVAGVFQPFTKELQLFGTGFRAEVTDRTLVMRVGFSHPVVLTLPERITIRVEKNTNIIISSPDKELLGTVAAKVRAVRPPDPYKGKGVRYAGEQLSLKPGKAAKAVGAGATG